jgi:hypothetical protein
MPTAAAGPTGQRCRQSSMLALQVGDGLVATVAWIDVDHDRAVAGRYPNVGVRRGVPKPPATYVEAEVSDMTGAVAHWIDLVAEMLTSEAARLVMRRHIREMVRAGTIPTMQVIEAATAGHEEADMALRELAAEIIDRGDPLPTALGAYVQKALLMAPVAYPPGRNIVDTWLRDVGIAVLVSLTIERWPHLKVTRNRASKRPSACVLVSLALVQRGHNVGERQVERIFGSLDQVARKLSASIPPI